ncbi:MAG: AsmA family protein [Candidatus Omnitrophica bacterium]|nr:AsmA family protein [Candidatus Omnitrophota bacterium]
MKKIIIIVLVLAILISGGIIYLNNVFLPTKIKSLIIQGIEERTNAKVTLESVRVNIFKGLVLKDLGIYQEETALLKVKEASCIFLPWSLLEKKIAIPFISLKSPQIFLERRKDNTFNLEDLVVPRGEPPVNTPSPASSPQAKAPAAKTKKGFTVLFYRLSISKAKIIFRDATFSPPYESSLENINIVIQLSLPSLVKFKLSAFIPAAQPVNISASGVFNPPRRELSAKLNVNNFSPEAFSVYYQKAGLKIAGLLSLASDIKMKDGILYADTQAQGKNLNIQQKNISVKADTALRVNLAYGLSDRKLQYSGSGKISNALISGLKFIDTLSALGGNVVFNNLGLSTENLTAAIFGIPVSGKVILNNFNDPALSIKANAGLSLEVLQAVLKDKLKFNFPGIMNGQGNLSLAWEGKLKEAGGPALTLWLDVVNADVKLVKLEQPIQNINGRITFTRGARQAFPLLDIALKSDTLTLASLLSLQNKLLKVSKCSGYYFASAFSLAGNIDNVNPRVTNVDLSGELSVDLKDLKYVLPKLKEQLAKARPEGKVKAQFNLFGNINDPKGYVINARLASEAISLYGLRGTDLFVSYAQANGLASVESARLSLYSGSLEAAFTVNLSSKDTPYWFTAALQGVEVKELKKDTPAKNKDISGIIQGEVKANGFLSDPANSLGAGRIAITKGRLWELDLFKGLGKLLFSQEFANIIFYEGACSFVIQDKSISTENLLLKSNVLNLSGPVRIGFDNSLNARLNVDILSEQIPLSGTFKDVTTAIISETGKFAVIVVSGTLKEPKYSFQAAVTDIIQGLADTFLKKL